MNETTTRRSHANCIHPRTPAGRRACRAESATVVVYEVFQVKIHYGRANDVTGIEKVPASRLYAELEARGVPRRLFTYENSTSRAVNGEFTQWRIV